MAIRWSVHSRRIDLGPVLDVTSVCGSSLYVAMHAEVDLDGDASTPGQETAFGGSNVGSGTRWWFSGVYSVC